MVHLIKFFALAIGVAFNGNVSESTTSFEYSIEGEEILKTQVDTSKNEIKDISTLGEGRIPLQPTHNHGCGHDHSLEVMRELDPDYDRKLEHYNKVILPQLQAEGKKLRESRLNRSQADLLSMPIVFHIIHQPGESVGVGQNLDDQTIIDQLETLNEDLNAQNAGWQNVPPRWENIKGNPELQFCLAEVDPNGNATSGIVRHEYTSVPDRDFIRNTIKPQTGWPSLDYYNVWILPIPGTTQFGGVLGWAYFPFPGTPGGTLDGTVQDYRFTGKGGKTLTHEVGHSWGLPHVWGNSGGCGNDDGIADTPPQETNTNAIQRMSCNGTTWPTAPSTCNGEEHMYINYMDYSPDACALTFTNGQADVMRAVTLGTSSQWTSRNRLVTNAQTVAQSCQVGTPTGGGGGDPGGGGPPIVLQHDAGIQTIITPTNGEFCSSEEITPVVLLVNAVGDTPLTSCTIRYKISGTPGSIAFNWTGNLAKGETEEVTLAPFISPEFSFEFTSWTTSPNGETDENGFNDERAISLSTPDVFDPNIFEDFENEDDFPTTTNIDEAEVENNIREWEIFENASAYGVGDGCVYFRNFNDPDGDGAIDILEFPVLDFAEIENPRLAFDISYYDTESIPEKDSIRIRVSADCGDTFTTVFYEGGQDLATVSSIQQQEFFPTPNLWRNEVVDLFQFSGANRLVIEIMNIGHSNNNVYIDNLNLSDGCASSVQIAKGDLTCGDECTGFANLILNGFVAEPQITWSNNVNGQTGEAIQDLCPGTYSVTVVDTEFDCEHILEVDIAGPDALELIVIANDITIPGAANGSAIAQGFGGAEPYTFQWDDTNNFTEAFLTGLRAGTYCVTMTDANGCSQEDCVTITGFECGMEIEIDLVQPECGGDGKGSGVVTVSNAVGNTTVFWSQGGQFGFLLGNINDNLSAGPLFIVVTDQGLDDCQQEFFFDIFPAVTPSISPVVENESSAGSSDGSITLNTDDDDSVYSYLWSNNETTEDITGLTAGTYTVTINDVNNNCELEETFIIENLNCTLTASAVITDVNCFDEANGAIEISASGGTTPYDFAWPSGPNVTMQGNLTAGIYPITVTDAAGCRVVYEAIVEQPALLDVILSTTDESIPGALDGSATATVIGGKAPYEYAWSNSQSGTNMITGLSGGIYLVTITDDNNCTTVRGASVDGRICPTIEVVTDGTNVACFGENSGTLSAVATGGVEPYTYLWTPGNYTTATVNDAPAGDYTLVVMDAEGCPANGAFTITQPNQLTVFSISGDNESVEGAMDGSVDINVIGGEGNLTYSWTGSTNSFTAETQNLVGLAPGEYCVVVTDENLCTAEACFTVGAGESPCVDFTNDNTIIELVNNISCFGSLDGSAAAFVVGGTGAITYLWSNGETGPTAINLPSGESSVIVTDGAGCISEQTITITEPEELAIGINVTNESMFGQEDGSLIIDTNNAVEPFICEWTGDGSFTNSACNLTDLGPGEYCLTLTDANGCIFEGCYTITAASDLCAEFAIGEIITTDVLCRGEGTGTASVSLIGGAAPFTYEWSDTSDDEVNMNLSAGQIGVTVTDNNNCVVTGSAMISEPELGLELSVTGINESAPNANDGSASASVAGGTGLYEYAWTGPGGFTSMQAIISDLSPGAYCVLVTDENGCTSEACVEVNEADAPDCSAFGIILSSEPITCNGFNDAVLVVDISNGIEPFTYTWNDPTLPNTPTQDNIGAGEYAVTVVDGNGCEATAEITVEDTELLEVSIEVQQISSPGAADAILTAVATGGDGNYSVLWNSIDDGFVFGPTGPGEVCVLLTDGNGCEATACVTLEDPIANCTGFDVALVITNHVTCFGEADGGVQVNIFSAEEPVEYEWTNGLDPIQIQTGLEPGVYGVTVTDANNCSTIAEIEVVEPESELVLDISAMNVSATGVEDGSATVVAVGGDADADYTYIWSDGQTTATAIDLAPGNYCVTVGSGSCSESTCIEVFTAEDLCAQFQIEEFVQNATCFEECDGLVELEIVGGQEPYNFQWSDGSTSNSLVSCAGPGGVTVTDANDCQAVISFIIGEPDEIELVTSATNATSLSANDGTANAAAFGGTAPFEFEWNGNREGASIEDLEPGTYTVTATDANGCMATSSVTVGIDEDVCADFSGTLEIQNVSCFGESDGVIEVNVEGGSGTYFYEYSNGTSLGNSLDGAAAGDFTVVVRDGNDCEFTLQGTITEPDELIIGVLESNNTSADNAADGSLIIEIEGGTNPYTTEWEGGFGDVLELSDLAVGEYTVTVTDDNGCSSMQTITIGSNGGGMMEDCSTLTASFDITPVSCFLDSDGSVEVEVSGGTPPYDISSSAGSLVALASNVYIITITDNAGCVFEQEIEVPGPSQLELLPTGFDGECGASALAQVVVSGGTGPFDIIWSNNETGPIISNLDSGVYGVTVTDANGCTDVDEVEVMNEFTPIDLDVTTTNVTCSDVEDGRINVTINQGMEPFTYLWSDGVTTMDRINIGAGTYTLEITDGSGCQFVLSRTILAPESLLASYSVSQGATSSLFDVTVNATGGTPPYNYSWSDGGNNFVNLGLTFGSYTVTITDDNLCEEIIEVEVEGVTSAVDLDIVSSFDMSPNPTNGQFLLDVTLSQSADVSVTVYNIMGQTVLTNSYRGNEIFDRLDLSNQPAGTYYVRLFNEAGQLTKKLIKVD